MMEWIKIKDRLPETDTDVLASHDFDKWVSECYLSQDGNWYNTWDDSDPLCPCYPTHWMNKPEPPNSN